MANKKLMNPNYPEMEMLPGVGNPVLKHKKRQQEEDERNRPIIKADKSKVMKPGNSGPITTAGAGAITMSDTGERFETYPDDSVMQPKKNQQFELPEPTKQSLQDFATSFGQSLQPKQGLMQPSAPQQQSRTTLISKEEAKELGMGWKQRTALNKQILSGTSSIDTANINASSRNYATTSEAASDQAALMSPDKLARANLANTQAQEVRAGAPARRQNETIEAQINSLLTEAAGNKDKKKDTLDINDALAQYYANQGK